MDRIVELRIEGLRAIDALTLRLDGLTVLVGENGAGKSAIIEALELLRKAASVHSFVSDVLVQQHGGLGALMRHGASRVRLGVSIEGGGPRVDYDLWLGAAGHSERVLGERVLVHSDSEPVKCLLWGHGGLTFIIDPPVPASEWGDLSLPSPHRVELTGHQVQAGYAQTALGLLGVGPPLPLDRLVSCLRSLEVHPPWATRALWQQRELTQQLGPRWPTTVDDVDRMPRYGVGLSNALMKLRNAGGVVWERVLTRARLGLGLDLRDLVLPTAGRGRAEVALRFAHAPERDYPAEVLSEGQLAYLCFVALVELADPALGAAPLVAVDEPELHLHPALLARVVFMFEALANSTPVLLATHSSQLLDLLPDPARSVVLCELVDRSVRVRRPNAERLAEWLNEYRGFGSLRDDGLETQVFDEPDGEATA